MLCFGLWIQDPEVVLLLLDVVLKLINGSDGWGEESSTIFIFPSFLDCNIFLSLLSLEIRC
jgi:hypothetical protein